MPKSKFSDEIFAEYLADDPVFERYRPSLLGINPHTATIWPTLTGSRQLPLHERIELDTPDGDFLEADVMVKDENAPLVTILHGLEGSTERYYVAELDQTLVKNGFSVIALNFRSCGSRMNETRRFYHSGETGDFSHLLNWVKSEFPNSKLFAVGFSLGGNVLAKSLGEERDSHLLDAAVVVSAPYDLERSAIEIASGFNRIYEFRFLRQLKQKLKKKREPFPDLPNYRGWSMWEFDDQVTAPIFQFEGARDYYNKSSSAQYFPKIDRPTLLLHSLQDPFCPIQSIPMKIVRENPKISHLFTRYGGHVGFPSTPKGWVNRQIAAFFAYHCK